MMWECICEVYKKECKEKGKNWIDDEKETKE